MTTPPIAACRSCASVRWDRLTHDWLCGDPRQPDAGRLAVEKALADPKGCGPHARFYARGQIGTPMPTVCVAPELRRAALLAAQVRIADAQAAALVAGAGRSSRAPERPAEASAAVSGYVGTGAGAPTAPRAAQVVYQRLQTGR